MSLKGIDISSWQPNLVIDQVPMDFVIIKATEGAGFVSPTCDKHYQQAKKAGKLRGVYHFARNTRNSSEAEAKHFLNNIRGYVKDAILVLDWEDSNTADVAWAKRWLDYVYKETGVKPLIYMSESVVNSHDWSSVANADYGLWVAKYRDNVADFNYNMALAGTPPNVKWWKFYTMWQWTSSGRLQGYDGNLDCNEFYGDAKAWQAYASASSVPTPQPNPAPKPQPTPAPVEDVYVVRSGDTLSALFPGNWKTVAAFNGIQNPNFIQVGQRLRLPDGVKVGGTAPVQKTYTVRRGDILSVLFPKNWKAVAAANGLANPDLIYPGQVLRLP